MTELLESGRTPRQTLPPLPHHTRAGVGSQTLPSPGYNEVPGIPTGATAEKAKEGGGIASLLVPHPEVTVETTRGAWTCTPTWQ